MSAGLEPDQLLALLHADLDSWVRERGGLLSVASDPFNFLELLAEAPAGWRAVLHFESDENRQDNPDEAALLDMVWSLGVTCQKGLSIRPEERLFLPGPAGAPALLRIVATLRLRMRGAVLPSCLFGGRVHYLGAQPLVLPNGTPLLGYQLRFRVTGVPTPVAVYRTLS